MMVKSGRSRSVPADRWGNEPHGVGEWALLVPSSNRTSHARPRSFQALPTHFQVGPSCNRRTRTNRPPCDTSPARRASRRTRATQRVQKVLSPANDLTGSSGADFVPNLLASPFGFDAPGGGDGVDQEESPPSVRTRPRFSQVRLGDWTPIDDLHFDGVPPFDADDHGGGRVSAWLMDRVGYDLTREQSPVHRQLPPVVRRGRDRTGAGALAGVPRSHELTRVS
jgi:hypothetical protein